MMAEPGLAFGPVPSRRLGRSLGINNIPPKFCTYSCVYCQLGRTLQMWAERRIFHDPALIVQAVQRKIRQTEGEVIDFLTFVPDGEPTLDIQLGQAIEMLRPMGISIAVITNASLIDRADVRADLSKADWVSLKIDAVTDAVWRRIDRPHGALSLPAILDGAIAFASSFSGRLVTETMLVAGVNDDPAQLTAVAAFVARLKPHTAYLAIPTRPPAEAWVWPPEEDGINRAYQIFCAQIENTEHLIGYEGNAFAFTGDVVEDLLNITAVHPMRQDAVSEFLGRAGADWSVVRMLVAQGRLVENDYAGQKFYVRRLLRAPLDPPAE